MVKNAAATRKLVETIDGYDDPVGDMHPAVKREYQAKALESLRVIEKALADGADWRATMRPSGDVPFSAAFFEDDRPLALLLDAGVPVDHQDAARSRTRMEARARRGNAVDPAHEGREEEAPSDRRRREGSLARR